MGLPGNNYTQLATRQRYIDNPNLCRQCSNPILLKLGQKLAEAKIKKFCSRSCAAKFNNRIYPKRHQEPKTLKLPRIPYVITLGLMTKGELFQKSKNWQSARTSIRRHAAFVFMNNGHKKSCFCGYNKCFNIAHKKPVSSFSDQVILNEINHPGNLIGLCPNHHWELDHGLLVGLGSS